MTKQLHELLTEQPENADLRKVERILEREEDRNEHIDVCLSGLKWARSIDRAGSILGAVMWSDCASRVSRLADDLDAIGATAEAAAFRKLRASIDLPDRKIRNGLIDWLDTECAITKTAHSLDNQINDISAALWAYMQENHKELPDVPVVSTRWPFDWLGSLFSK